MFANKVRLSIKFASFQKIKDIRLPQVHDVSETRIIEVSYYFILDLKRVLKNVFQMLTLNERLSQTKTTLRVLHEISVGTKGQTIVRQ